MHSGLVLIKLASIKSIPFRAITVVEEKSYYLNVVVVYLSEQISMKI